MPRPFFRPAFRVNGELSVQRRNRPSHDHEPSPPRAFERMRGCDFANISPAPVWLSPVEHEGVSQVLLQVGGLPACGADATRGLAEKPEGTATGRMCVSLSGGWPRPAKALGPASEVAERRSQRDPTGTAWRRSPPPRPDAPHGEAWIAVCALSISSKTVSARRVAGGDSESSRVLSTCYPEKRPLSKGTEKMVGATGIEPVTPAV